MPRGPRQAGGSRGHAGVKVLVDYAHKPDALEAVLRACGRSNRAGSFASLDAAVTAIVASVR